MTIVDASLVSRDPEIMSGALCFAGTRVPVKGLFDYLEGSSSLEDFLQDFPSISRVQAVAVLEAARARLTPMRLLLDESVPIRLRRDKNLRHQQNLSALPLAVVLLDSPSVELAALLRLVPALEKTLLSLPAREFVRVSVDE